MSARRLAPTLQRLVEYVDDEAPWNDARRELRALLAVARAADEMLDRSRPYLTVLRDDLRIVTRMRKGLDSLDRLAGSRSSPGKARTR